MNTLKPKVLNNLLDAYLLISEARFLDPSPKVDLQHTLGALLGDISYEAGCDSGDVYDLLMERRGDK